MDDLLRSAGRKLALIAAIGLAGLAPARPAAARPAAPAMWKVADADTIIYLFGTFHLLPEGTEWRTRTIDEALARSSELVLETVLDGEEAALAQTMIRLGSSPGLPPLSQRVPEEKRAALAAMIADARIPAASLDPLETWAAALVLNSVTFQRLGLDPAKGVEKMLTGTYRQAGKPVHGLESIEEQLGFLDRLSEPAQRAFLVATLDDPAEARAQFATMLSAWTKGDVDGIAAAFNGDVAMSPELRDALLKQRNARWTEWVARRLERPGTVFVAVGAGHLAGPESVQAMLEARGLKAQRVQ
jgi:uncharacterized protein YbaP (TraB family)